MRGRYQSNSGQQNSNRYAYDGPALDRQMSQTEAQRLGRRPRNSGYLGMDKHPSQQNRQVSGQGAGRQKVNGPPQNRSGAASRRRSPNGPNGRSAKGNLNRSAGTGTDSRRPGRRRIPSPFYKKPWFAAGMIVLVFVVALSMGVSALWQNTLGQIKIVNPDKGTAVKGEVQKFADVPEPELINPVPYDKDITNILLLGIDSRDQDAINERSDSMIILTINKTQKKIKLTSLQRDMLVYMPGMETPDKLTHANQIGGPEYSMRVINETLRLSIDRYAIVNIRKMEEMIDLVGGVYLNVTEYVAPTLNDIIGKMNREFMDTPAAPTFDFLGEQLFNGRQAVAYARNRSTPAGDYDRMSYQQEVLQALFNRFKDVSMGDKLKMIKEGLGMVSTNLTHNEILGIVQSVLPMMNEKIDNLTIPIPGYHRHYSGMAWVNLCDFNGMIPQVQEFIFGKTFPFDPVREIPGAPNSSVPLIDNDVDEWVAPEGTGPVIEEPIPPLPTVEETVQQPIEDPVQPPTDESRPTEPLPEPEPEPTVPGSQTDPAVPAEPTPEPQPTEPAPQPTPPAPEPTAPPEPQPEPPADTQATPSP